MNSNPAIGVGHVRYIKQPCDEARKGQFWSALHGDEVEEPHVAACIVTFLLHKLDVPDGEGHNSLQLDGLQSDRSVKAKRFCVFCCLGLIA